VNCAPKEPKNNETESNGSFINLDSSARLEREKRSAAADSGDRLIIIAVVLFLLVGWKSWEVLRLVAPLSERPGVFLALLRMRHSEMIRRRSTV